MAEPSGNIPVKTNQKAVEASSGSQLLRPFESLRREVDRLFENFGGDFWQSPFRRMGFGIEPFSSRDISLGAAPAVDIVEKDMAYEISAELPRMDEKNIEVKVRNRGLTIKGERKEEKEEKRAGYYLQERRFGAFERSFGIPEGVDADKIEATFNKGVLTVILPKTPEAQKPEKKIAVKTV
jgi:HSP20 family protein